MVKSTSSQAVDGTLCKCVHVVIMTSMSFEYVVKSGKPAVLFFIFSFNTTLAPQESPFWFDDASTFALKYNTIISVPDMLSQATSRVTSWVLVSRMMPKPEPYHFLDRSMLFKFWNTCPRLGHVCSLVFSLLLVRQRIDNFRYSLSHKSKKYRDNLMGMEHSNE